MTYLLLQACDSGVKSTHICRDSEGVGDDGHGHGHGNGDCNDAGKCDCDKSADDCITVVGNRGKSPAWRCSAC